VVEKQTGRRPKELDPPVDFPNLLIHVWNAFISLSGTRQAGFSGPGPISYRDIKDWMDLTKNRLSPRDVELVVDLDKIYLRVING